MGAQGLPTMKAWVYRKYGGPEVVHLEDVPKPAPKENEILVRIVATSVTAGDWRVRTLHAPKGFGLIARLAIGLTGPRQPIMGTELAGIVESVGKRVTRFEPGDAVLAFPGGRMGCHAEYRAVAEDGPVAAKPGNLSFDEAAALPFGGSTALHFLRKAALKPGERVLVVGASGNVGSMLVQLARREGAHVTGVASAKNADLVRSLGADQVIDSAREDHARRGETYDVIADTVGNVSFKLAEPLLHDGGRLLAIAGGLPEMLATLRGRRPGGKRVIAGPAEERPEDVAKLADLARTGALRAVIDRRYAFAQMREAHAYVETRRKRGSVIVTVAPAGP